MPTTCHEDVAPRRRLARARVRRRDARTPRTSCRSIARRRSRIRRSRRRARSGKPRRSACRRRAPGCCRRCPRRARPTSTTTTRNSTRTPRATVSQNYGFGSLVFSASQPLYRPQNVVVLDQAREQVTQSDCTLGIAQQDLIIRTTVAYFDVLLAEFNVELAEQQKIAVSEQLAQAKRNFEVGTATITDTNEAQAKYDQIIATEIQARNDLDRRRTALRRDHRQDAAEPEAHRPRIRARAARAQQPRLLGRAGAAREPQRALRAIQLRDRLARGGPRARRPPAHPRPRRRARARSPTADRRRPTSAAIRAPGCSASS